MYKTPDFSEHFLTFFQKSLHYSVTSNNQVLSYFLDFTIIHLKYQCFNRLSCQMQSKLKFAETHGGSLIDQESDYK